MLLKTIASDGIETQNMYDAARNLIGFHRNNGDGTYDGQQFTLNAMSQPTRVEVLRTDYPPDTVVTGHIDDVTHDGAWNWFVRGWACTTGSNASIDVLAYAGSTFLLGGKADAASDPTVAQACQAHGTAYRFQLPITLAQRRQLGGQGIAVYGISPVGDNRALGNSGNLAIPAANVIGDIGGITEDGNWNYFVEGWACSTGVNSSIDVHLYVGGPAGSGTGVSSGTANLTTDANVAQACQSQGSAYWFRLPLDGSIRAAHGNQPIYIHGISPAGGANLLINGSGSFTVPAIVRSAEIVSFAVSPDHIFNGDTATLTAQVRNTGNVVWGAAGMGNTYLAWGTTSLSNSMALSGPVAPGAVAVFTRPVSAVHAGSGVGNYGFLAQMATDGEAWGPRGSTVVAVENPNAYCPPNKPYCEVPKALPQSDASDGQPAMQGGQ